MPARPGRAAEVAQAVGDRPAVLGPVVPGAEASRSLRRATATLQLVALGVLRDQGLVSADDSLAELIVHADKAPCSMSLPSAGSRHWRSVPSVRAIGCKRPWRRGSIIRATCRPPPATLGVHPQTVRYRLEQLREAFGDDLEDPAARFELSLAVRAWPTLTSAPTAP